jgi:hypothetical protein
LGPTTHHLIVEFDEDPLAADNGSWKPIRVRRPRQRLLGSFGTSRGIDTRETREHARLSKLSNETNRTNEAR